MLPLSQDLILYGWRIKANVGIMVKSIQKLLDYTEDQNIRKSSEHFRSVVFFPTRRATV